MACTMVAVWGMGEREQGLRTALGAHAVRVDERAPIALVGPWALDLDAPAGDVRELHLVERIDRLVVARALGRGAKGIIELSASEEVLIAAINAVAAGLTVVPDAVNRSVVRPRLTTREKQVLGLLVLENSNRAIAERLFVAEATIKMHLTNVFAKLGVTSRAEAIELVLDPSAGLGLGITELGPSDRPQVAYGTPKHEPR